jgi:hypothetical protein
MSGRVARPMDGGIPECVDTHARRGRVVRQSRERASIHAERSDGYFGLRYPSRGRSPLPSKPGHPFPQTGEGKRFRFIWKGFSDTFNLEKHLAITVFSWENTLKFNRLDKYAYLYKSKFLRSWWSRFGASFLVVLGGSCGVKTTVNTYNFSRPSFAGITLKLAVFGVSVWLASLPAVSVVGVGL